MRRIVLCDLDHTVTDAFWRDPMIGGPGGWDAYHEAGDGDLPLTDTIQVVNSMAAAGFRVIGLTARPEKWRSLTNTYLMRHGILMREMLMRPDNCFLPSPRCKLEEISRHLGENWRDQIVVFFEDRDDVVAAFRAEGITVAQIHARRGVR